MASAAVSTKAGKIFVVATVTAFAVLLIDKLAEWAYVGGILQSFDGLILRNDLQYLPGLSAIITVGWLFRNSRKSQLAGIVASAVSAGLMFFIIGKLPGVNGWHSMLWQTIGYQSVYLFVPTFLSILIGGFVAKPKE